MTWQDPYGQYGQNPYGQPGWQQHTGPGWQDPYAQQDPYGGHQGYGYYGPPGGMRSAGSNGATVGALVANIVCAVLCCGTVAWLPGIILAAVAMNRTQTDPASARQLTLWSWICSAISIVLGVVLLVVLLAVGAFHTAAAPTP